MPSFQVVYTKAALNSFQAVVERAIALGKEEEVYQAAEIIDTGLQGNPRAFGDPLFNLHLLEMHHRGVSPLVVAYAVHKTEPVVFVRKILALGNLG